MKIFVTFKDPDTMHDAVSEAFDKVEKPDGIDDDEWGLLAPSRRDKVVDQITADFMAYGEYITIEFNTEARTARVVPRSEKR
jgi:hypothetical protein